MDKAITSAEKIGWATLERGTLGIVFVSSNVSSCRR